MKISISNTFDAGNIEVINAENPENIQLKIRKDTHSDFYNGSISECKELKIRLVTLS